MKNLDPKVIVLYFIKNFLGTIYILPLWFIGIYIFERFWMSTTTEGTFFQELVILAFYGAGWIFLIILLLGCYYWAWLTFVNFTYELQPDGLHIKRGVIIRRHITIPYADLESIQLLVNPFVLRFLELYTVQIISREVENTEGVFRKRQKLTIPGLTSEEARSLKAEILNYSHINIEKRTFFDPISGHYK